MEGLTGVTSYEQVVPGGAQYEEGRALLMHDLIAVIEGILSTDKDAEIIVFDEHFYGRNVKILELPPQVRYVSGKPQYTDKCAGFIEGCDGMFLVGFHAKMGTPIATMPHTYEHDILDIQVNGASVGEVGVEAAIAGDAGVPTLFYSGDSMGAVELAALTPETVKVNVKESVSEHAAICLPGKKTYRLLFKGAQEAVRKQAEISPFTLGSPVVFRVRLKPNQFRKTLHTIRPDIFEDADWVSIVAPTVTTAFSQYWRWKAKTERLLHP